jgi:triphosphoribosyl-dephospho-CoA synthase
LSSYLNSNCQMPPDMETALCIAAEIPSPARDLQTECLRLEQICMGALRDEVMAWPKPGLVTPVDSGSHRDMNIGTLLSSIDALHGSFARLVHAGARGASFAALRDIGMQAERKMLLATAGVNTHRGAIFNLGLLVAAAARRRVDHALQKFSCGDVVARVWGAEIAAARTQSPVSHGNSVYKKFAVGGARTEAAAGFPSVYNIGLPVLRCHLVAGHDRETAQIATLLALMEYLPDTNLLWRGGEAGLEFVRESAAEFNRDGGVAKPGWQQRLLELHHDCVARNLSPGGSADLMAATWVAHILDLNPDCPLEPTPLQLPLAAARGMQEGIPQLCCDPASNRGRAQSAPPLIRGGWEGFKPNEQSGLNFTAG